MEKSLADLGLINAVLVGVGDKNYWISRAAFDLETASAISTGQAEIALEKYITKNKIEPTTRDNLEKINNRDLVE